MASAEPPLVGLVLAGGQSRRMKSDKGALKVRDQTLVERALCLVEPHCETACVSVRRDQSGSDAYRDLSLVFDAEGTRGPAAGLLAAWEKAPGSALLVLAVDLPLVTAPTLETLVSRRNPAAAATAFRHPDGTIEPLCTIWEPPLAPVLTAAGPAPSLRRILEESGIEVLEPPDPAELASTNTPEALEAAREVLSGP